jgi:NADPH-ferrihemoprotein reductase
MRNKENKISNNYLQNVSYSVFGLGNKKYQNYNKMGKTTNSTLEKFGAKRIYEYGEGDDGGIIEDDFKVWMDGIMPVLYSIYNPNASLSGTIMKRISRNFSSLDMEQYQSTLDNQSVTPIYQFQCEKYNISNIENDNISQVSVIPTMEQWNTTTKHFFMCIPVRVLVNRELRQQYDDNNFTRHIELDITNTNITYNTAGNNNV